LTNWTSLNTSRTSQAQAVQATLSNQTGVNVDDQLERLMAVQQTYEASSEIISTVTQMFNSLAQAVSQP
jgi:flagellar hook-associated protein 1 FlgK